MRRALAIALVCLGVGLVIAAVATDLWKPAKNAAQAVSDQAPAPRSELLNAKVTHTKACLTDSVQALLDLGERDIDALTDWAVRHCSQNLTYYLAHELERPQGMTADYVHATARNEVIALARQRR